MRRVRKCKEENPELLKEVNAWKVCRQMFGRIAGVYVSMREFESRVDLEKCRANEEKDENFRKMHQELLNPIDPATFSMRIWASVM